MVTDYIEIALTDIKTTDKLQPRVRTDMFIVDEYAQAMRDGVPFPPIEIIYDGEIYWLWDGFHRMKAAQQARLDSLTANVQEGTLSDAEWLALGANKKHGMRRRNEDKRRVVELAFEHPLASGLSDRQLAEHCGVTHPFVGKIRETLSQDRVTGNGYQLHDSTIRLGLDNKTRVISRIQHSPTENIIPQARQRLSPTDLIEDKQVIEYLAELDPVQQLPSIDKLLSGESKPPLSQPMQVLLSHKEVEYYTPAKYVEAARRVMGGIDLDPASCEEAQQTIKATRFFTQEDDGLSQEWYGRVWLNPPYSKTGGKSNQELWSEYLISQYQKGNVTEGILLVKSTLGYEWFERLWDLLPACFIRQRLSFTKSDGSSDGSSKYGTTFFYVGENPQRFIDIFSVMGRITIPDRGKYICQRLGKMEMPTIEN